MILRKLLADHPGGGLRRRLADDAHDRLGIGLAQMDPPVLSVDAQPIRLVQRRLCVLRPLCLGSGT